jgi:hypothetical protein
MALCRRETNSRLPPSHEQENLSVTGEFDLGAMRVAVHNLCDGLRGGLTLLGVYSETNIYVVDAKQTSPCPDCSEPVHVLQATLLADWSTECTVCKGKRCIRCSRKFARALDVTESQHVGVECTQCGADRTYVDVVRRATDDGVQVGYVNLTRNVNESQLLKRAQQARTQQPS